ncbi:MAG: hypothetical protein Tsb009_01060 [Planctomycetaceae bacterium]
MTRKAFVLVHMWFRKGEGWAFHPSIGDHLEKFIGAVEDYVRSPELELTFELPFNRGVLIGEKIPDHNCQDPKAENRNPFILRVAYLQDITLDDIRFEENILTEVREKLRELELPEQNGRCKALKLRLQNKPTEFMDEESETAEKNEERSDSRPPPLSEQSRHQAEKSLDQFEDLESARSEIRELRFKVRGLKADKTYLKTKLKDRREQIQRIGSNLKWAGLFLLGASVVSLALLIFWPAIGRWFAIAMLILFTLLGVWGLFSSGGLIKQDDRRNQHRHRWH